MIAFSILVSVCAAALTAVAAEPSISTVEISQSGGTSSLIVTYDLDDAPAVVTVNILTNGVPVLDSASGITGDGNCKVSMGKGRRIRYRPARELRGVKIDGVTVELKAWPLASPPDYAVWDLTANNVPDSLRFYECESAIPGGVHSDRYATTHFVMRKIPVGGTSQRLGTNNLQGDINDNRCIPRLVSFTHDFYCGIFELTQGQTEKVWIPPVSSDGYLRPDVARIPLNNISYDDIRGQVDGANWPSASESQSHKVDEGSLIHAFRQKLGVQSMDLPSAAKWEVSYRAGSWRNHYWGLERARTTVAEEILAATNNAWTAENCSSLQPVGTRLANGYGLYDVAGNVYEYCLDWFATGDALSDGSDQTDPQGPDSGTARVIAGGAYIYPSESSTFAYVSAVGFDAVKSDIRAKYIGLRLVCNAAFLTE